MIFRCDECAREIADIEPDELMSMAADSMQMRKDHSAGEGGSERVRSVPCPDWGSLFAAWDIINHSYFDLLYDPDIRTNLAKLDALGMLFHAKRHLMPMEYLNFEYFEGVK